MFTCYAVIGLKCYEDNVTQNYINIFSDMESAERYFEKAKEIIIKENEDLISRPETVEKRGVLITKTENEKMLIEEEGHHFIFTDKEGLYKEVLKIESHGIDDPIYQSTINNQQS